jgi:hypothetical protein
MCISEYMIEQDEFRLARIAYERQWDTYLEQVIDYHEERVNAQYSTASIQPPSALPVAADYPLAA